MTPKPLRILHLTAGSDAGGVSRYILDLGVAMRDMGHDVAVAGQRGAWHEAFERSGLEWIDANLKAGPLGLWAESGRLAAHVRHHGVDLLHVHYRKAALAARLMQWRLSWRGSTIPVLYTLHLTDMPMGFPRRNLSVFGDCVHVASADARQWMIDTANYPADRIALIPHGIQAERFPVADEAACLLSRHRFNLPETSVVAAYVGRLDYPKNVDWLLELAQHMPQLHVLLAGGGPDEPKLQAAIRQLDLGSRVKLLGECDPRPIYAAADVLLLPSLREGFSYVCGEAMSCGRPVLRTRTAGTTKLIIENVTGRSCAIDRQAFLTAAMDMLSLPRSRLAEMGQAAAHHIRQSLRFDQQVAGTVELYRRLLARPDKAR